VLENVFHIKKLNSSLLGLVGLQELMTGKKMASGPTSSLQGKGSGLPSVYYCVHHVQAYTCKRTACALRDDCTEVHQSVYHEMI
jgi:hypothetical protein